MDFAEGDPCYLRNIQEIHIISGQDEKAALTDSKYEASGGDLLPAEPISILFNVVPSILYPFQLIHVLVCSKRDILKHNLSKLTGFTMKSHAPSPMANAITLYLFKEDTMITGTLPK